MLGSSQAIAVTSATCSGGETARAARALSVAETLEPLMTESSPPLADALGGAVQALGDPPVGLALGGIEDHPRTLNLTEGLGLGASDALELVALHLAQLDPDLSRHYSEDSPPRVGLLPIYVNVLLDGSTSYLPRINPGR